MSASRNKNRAKPRKPEPSGSLPVRAKEAPMSQDTIAQSIEAALERFGERVAVAPDIAGLGELERIAAHRSHRRYLSRAIEPALLRLLCACALSAPSKSDLQHADIVIVNDKDIRKQIVAT